MATYIEIDALNRTVFSRIEGVLDFATCKDHMKHLLTDATFQPAFSQVIDFRKADRLELSPDEVRTLAQRTVFSPTSRRAFLVSTAIQFGMARMFSTHRDLNGEGFVGVFKTVDEAAAWLSVTSNFIEEKLARLRAQPV